MAWTAKITTAVCLAGRRLRTFVHPNVIVGKVPPNVHADRNLPVKVRDGTTLRVNVFPSEPGTYPVIMSAHPYDKDRIPARSRSGRAENLHYRLFPQPEPVSFSEWTSWEAPDPGVWVPRGYVVVNADLRGGGTSEGTGDVFSDEEAQDYYDLIEWAGVQPWSNGRVGLDGVSYLCMSQYKVAALNPSHLAAVCPWESFSDLYRDFTRPGGSREDGFSIVWSKGTKNIARLRGDICQEICARPERDEWYRSKTPNIERIEVPMLVCASFSDHSLHSRGSFEVFRRAASPQKWLYTHRSGKWSTYYSQRATAVWRMDGTRGPPSTWRSTTAAPIPSPSLRKTLGRPAISTGGRFGSIQATWYLERRLQPLSPRPCFHRATFFVFDGRFRRIWTSSVRWLYDYGSKPRTRAIRSSSPAFESSEPAPK